jgi:putative FmdB family regulatory protein
MLSGQHSRIVNSPYYFYIEKMGLHLIFENDSIKLLQEDNSMPIYEYKCQTCGHQLEAIQKISDSPLTDCPKCGKNSLGKEISATRFQLKGTGWYATDYKNSATPPKKEEAATSQGEGSSEKKPKEEKPSDSK